MIITSFCCYVHYGMIRRKKNFSFCYYVHHAMIKRENSSFYFRTRFATPQSQENKRFLLHHYLDPATIMKKIYFPHFTATFTMIFLHLITLVTGRKVLQTIFFSFKVFDDTTFRRRPDGIYMSNSYINVVNSTKKRYRAENPEQTVNT